MQSHPCISSKLSFSTESDKFTKGFTCQKKTKQTLIPMEVEATAE